MKPLLSTSNELVSILGKKTYAQLEGLVPDKKEFFALAARYLQLNELELFMKLAERLKLPLLTKLTDDFERVSVRGIPEQEYRDKAFVFFKTKTGLHGVACSDPGWLTPYSSRFSQFPTVLASWSLLQTWLTDFEISEEKDLPAEIVKAKRVASLPAEKAIDAVVDAVASMGVSAAALDFSPDRIDYEVIAPDLNTYRGEIKTPEAVRVEEILALSLLKNPHIVEREISGICITITISSNPRRRRFYIQWTPQLPKTLAINARLLIENSKTPDY